MFTAFVEFHDNLSDRTETSLGAATVMALGLVLAVWSGVLQLGNASCEDWQTSARMGLLATTGFLGLFGFLAKRAWINSAALLAWGAVIFLGPSILLESACLGNV